MKIFPPFPTCREATPTRRAEKRIYEALEASELDGLALYEVKPLSTAPQLDFAVWLLDIGTFGIQGKGGRYIMIDGEWHLITDRGQIRKESPIPGMWDAAMAIHDVVQEHLRHKTFVLSTTLWKLAESKLRGGDASDMYLLEATGDGMGTNDGRRNDVPLRRPCPVRCHRPRVVFQGQSGHSLVLGRLVVFGIRAHGRQEGDLQNVR